MEQRPGTDTAAVKSIAWIWIFLALFSLLTSLFFLSAMQSSNFTFSGQFSGNFGGMPGPMDNLMGLFEYIQPMLVTNSIMAGVVLIIAIAFLRLQPWARFAMLGLNYLGLLSLVGFWGGWLTIWWKSSDQMGVPTAFFVIGAIIAFSVMIVFSIPVVLMLRSLHGKRVRSCFVKQSPAPPPTT